MPIEIIIEDGSIVENANAFDSLENVRFFAAQRNVTLSEDDEIVKSQMIKASDYLNSKECDFQGQIVSIDQNLVFPRYNVLIADSYLPADVIPKSLKTAFSQLIIAQADGFDLQPNTSAEDWVTEETIGPITTKYANPVSVGIEASFSAVDAALKPLMKGADGCGFSLKTLRV